MTLAMCAKITFHERSGRPGASSFVIKKPSNVAIESGWKVLTDKARIVIPRKSRYFDRFKVNEVFKKGDPVTIELGYNGVYHVEFEGYVSRLSADIPIVIECEDEMYQLKGLPVNISTRAITLPELLKQMAPDYDIDALEVELGPQRFPRTTMAKVLEYFQNEYNLYSYFKGKTLVVGKIYQDDSDLPPIKLHLEKNVVNQNLNYKNKEDILIRIKAISTLRSGKKIEIEVGDKQGEQRILSYYGIEILAELEKLALEDLRKYKIDGFDGSVETFGIPKIEHGNKVELISDLYPDRSGIYYVEEVKKSFTDSATFRRSIRLGEKVI